MQTANERAQPKLFVRGLRVNVNQFFSFSLRYSIAKNSILCVLFQGKTLMDL